MSESDDVRADAGRAAEVLRLVLASIDAAELEAEQDQRAYLIGAADALEALAGGVSIPSARWLSTSAR